MTGAKRSSEMLRVCYGEHSLNGGTAARLVGQDQEGGKWLPLSTSLPPIGISVPAD